MNETIPAREERPPCPAPADFLAEVAAYDDHAEVLHHDNPRRRLTCRVLGSGPPLLVCPGIASTYRSYALLLNRLAERFQTILVTYPGDLPADHARLRRITHDHLVDDVFEVIEFLRLGRVFLFGISFGSTVVLQALRNEPRRFPRASVQGGFARREYSWIERLALALCPPLRGRVGGLPLHEAILVWNNRAQFPTPLLDRWSYFVEQNGLTPIPALRHRLTLLSRLDLRPILSAITTEILVIQGNEDRLVPRRYYDELIRGLPHATGVVLPTVGHQPQFTHAELLARLIGEFLLPCAPAGCPNQTPS